MAQSRSPDLEAQQAQDELKELLDTQLSSRLAELGLDPAATDDVRVLDAQPIEDSAE